MSSTRRERAFRDSALRGNEHQFWALVDVRSKKECWPWLGRVRKERHRVRPILYFLGEALYAHRVAFFYHYGCWPRPQANHHCDTPLCCNPHHLYEGTQLQNVKDREDRNRRKPASGSKAPGAKLDAKAVENIRRLKGHMPGTKIALAYDVHFSVIYRIWAGEKYTND